MGNMRCNGWAGCEFPKEADWSKCDALQFFIKPDGNNQKTVVQISTAGGGSYEAYLQEYPEYASTTEPMLVTMPFSEFQDKNGKGSLSSEAAADVSGFGLWVNAIKDSPAIDENGEVRGVLYYDDIKAVASGRSAPEFAVMEQGAKASGEARDKEAEKGLEPGNGTESGTEPKGSISFADCLLPLASGVIALVAAACAVALMAERKKR